jgi:hypothetical protein
VKRLVYSGCDVALTPFAFKYTLRERVESFASKRRALERKVATTPSEYGTTIVVGAHRIGEAAATTCLDVAEKLETLHILG